MTLADDQRAYSAQGAKRKAATGKRKGKLHLIKCSPLQSEHLAFRLKYSRDKEMKNKKQLIEELCTTILAPGANSEAKKRAKLQLIRKLELDPPDVIDSKLKAKLGTVRKEIQLRQQEDDYEFDEDEALDKQLLPLLEQVLK